MPEVGGSSRQDAVPTGARPGLRRRWPDPAVSARALFAVALCLICGLATAAQPFVNAAIVLLQPDEVLRQRIKSPMELAKYIKGVEAAADKSMQTAFQRRPAGGFVVIALKPGRKVKVWLDLDTPMPLPMQDALRAAIEALVAPELVSGVVVFALKASFWGGRPPARAGPAPEEWKAEAARDTAKPEVGALVERVWKD